MTDILQKHGITFDEAKHAYTSKAGFPLPSVTQILPFKCDGAEDVIRKAAERGHRVHKAIEWWELMGGASLSHTPVDMAFIFAECPYLHVNDGSYFEAWLKFKEVTGFELARLPISSGKLVQGDDGIFRVQQTMALAPLTPMVERFVFHPGFNFVGRLDLIGYLKRIPGLENDLTLVDAKTVAVLQPTTALQTSAYQAAINLELKALGLPSVKHRWAAQLKPDGSCRRFSFTDHKGDFSVFLARLNWMRWALANGYEQVAPDPFVEPEVSDHEIEEVMARL